MNANLLTGQLVRLAALNAEEAVEAFARWGVDTEFGRQLNISTRPPNRPQQIQLFLEKEQSEDPTAISFSVRTLADDRMIGFVVFDGINWQHGDTFVAIGVGDPDYRGRGYGTDAMRVMLRFGFQELNLHRIQLNAFSYNERAIKSYLKAGFVLEGRARGMLLRDGQRWDFVYMGVLRKEWLALNDLGAQSIPAGIEES